MSDKQCLSELMTRSPRWTKQVRDRQKRASDCDHSLPEHMCVSVIISQAGSGHGLCTGSAYGMLRALTNLDGNFLCLVCAMRRKEQARKQASRKQVCTPRQTSQWISLPCIPLELIQPFLGGLLSCACYPELCSLQSFFFKLLSIILPSNLLFLLSMNFILRLWEVRTHAIDSNKFCVTLSIPGLFTPECVSFTLEDSPSPCFIMT